MSIRAIFFERRVSWLAILWNKNSWNKEIKEICPKFLRILIPEYQSRAPSVCSQTWWSFKDLKWLVCWQLGNWHIWNVCICLLLYLQCTITSFVSFYQCRWLYCCEQSRSWKTLISLLCTYVRYFSTGNIVICFLGQVYLFTLSLAAVLRYLLRYYK